jgi:hypothetical protein
MPAAMVYLAMASESSIVLKLDSSDVVLWLFRQLEIHEAPFLADALALMSEQRLLIYLPPAGSAGRFYWIVGARKVPHPFRVNYWSETLILRQ